MKVHVRLRGNNVATGVILTPNDTICVEDGRVRVQWDDNGEITHCPLHVLEYHITQKDTES